MHYRAVEACALLPMLHIAASTRPTVACTGPSAEILAAEVLRWPDVTRVYLTEQPLLVRDRRVAVGAPPAASCQLVVCSPNEDPSPHLPALAPHGLLNTSADIPAQTQALMEGMRRLFRGCVPWREWAPTPLYGVLATPGGGKIARQRHPPAGARRLTSQYLPCLFTFGKDELPCVLPRHDAARPIQPDQVGTPEFVPR